MYGSLPAVGSPVRPNRPKIGVYRGLSGPTSPNIGFLLANSYMDPTCKRHTIQTESAMVDCELFAVNVLSFHGIPVSSVVFH